MTAIPQAPPPPEPGDPVIDIDSMLVAEWTRDVLYTIGDTTPRSLQDTIGGSEVGQRCRRRKFYRLAGTPPVNIGDPTKSLIGIGTHEVLRLGLTNLDCARYLCERRITYRGVPGQLDVYDMRKRRIVDWKTTSSQRIRRYRNEGPPANYLVQINIYAAGLAAEGWPVEQVAIVFIPRDGEASDVYAWVGQPDRALADQAIDSLEELRADLERGLTPGDVDAWQSPLCRWCPNYNPSATDLAVACPGT